MSLLQIDILVRRLVEQLSYKEDILLKHFYFPSIFKPFIYDFNPQHYSLKFPSENYFEYSEGFGVFFEEHKEKSVLSLEKFINTCQIPLPDWAKEVQYSLLSHVYSKSSDGWSLDLFCSCGKDKTLGSHIDNDDVYTVQLYGTKKWIIDPPDLYRLEQLINDQKIRRLSSSETWINNSEYDLQFNNPTIIVMNPGDFLAMPAFALHNVITLTDGLNFSFNVGIRKENYFVNSLSQSPKENAS